MKTWRGRTHDKQQHKGLNTGGNGSDNIQAGIRNKGEPAFMASASLGQGCLMTEQAMMGFHD